jgi:hypothetical protein
LIASSNCWELFPFSKSRQYFMLLKLFRDLLSIKTGPKATITIYDNENFVERSERVGPSQEIENLNDRMELFDSFRSMKIDC